MSRKRSTTLGLATAGLSALALAPGALAQTVTWAPTHTQALHLKAPSLGATPVTEPIRLQVALAMRNRALAERLVERHTILTRSQATAIFSPTAATVRAVNAYLRSQGFATRVSADRLLISAQGTVGQAERAFHTRLSSFRLNGATVHVNTAAAEVPAALSGKVLAVVGLQDTPMALPKLTTRPAATPPVPPQLNSFTDPALETAYQADKVPPADGTSIAILGTGNMDGVVRDLNAQRKDQKYPPVKTTVIYNGPGAADPKNPLSDNLEFKLDTQASTAMAHNVKGLTIYSADTYTDPEVLWGINKFVADDRATALSVSLGECEFIAATDGAMIAADQALIIGGTQGQSAFASTGDNGFACPEVASTGAPGGPPDVSWPAVGEYMDAVGGTTLLANQDGSNGYEAAWIGGGGGSSPFETAPTWTLGAFPVGQVWQFDNQGGRTIPDVSALADGNTPILVYDNGTYTGVGGTSVASPLTMGLWARTDNAFKDQAGLAQYDFYELYNAANPATVTDAVAGKVYVPATSPQDTPGFRDITLGTNGGCAAKAGYDTCTGIGSLQVQDLITALGKVLKTS